MQLQRIAPLFTTEDLDATKAFYTTHLGFAVQVEFDGYLCLRHPASEHLELSFMPPGPATETCAAAPAASGDGLYYVLLVDDVDAEHERLVQAGVSIQDAPADMPWGDRRMTLKDPAGVTLYVCHPIEVPAETAS